MSKMPRWSKPSRQHSSAMSANDCEGDELVESIENSVDRMRDEGGIAPELPHSEGRAEEISQQLQSGTLHA